MRTVTGWAVIGMIGVLTAGGMGRMIGAAEPASAVKAADSAEESPTDPVVAALIADLGSPDYRTREKAGKLLEAKGDKALPDLRRALTRTDNPEVSRRLLVMVRRMDYERLVSPRRVSLTVKDQPVKTILDEIAKQSGYRIEYNGNGNAEQKFSFQFQNIPFWQAVDTVANAAGVGVYPNYDDEMIQVNGFQDSLNPYVSYAGPFRFIATGINSNRNVQLAGLSKRGGFTNRTPENINFSFQVYSEPKNPILGTLNAELVAATDESGASLVPSRDPNNVSRSYYNNPGYRTHNAYGGVNLVRAGRDATTIKSLKGKIGIVLLAGVVPDVVIPDPLKTKNKSFTGRTVEVVYDSMKEANGQYTVSLTIKKVGAVADPNGVDYSWANGVWQRLEISDAKGNKYRNFGANNMNNNGGSVQMTVIFGPADRRGRPQKYGPPAKLVVNDWLSVIQEVTFEFKDIPLP